MDAGGEALVKLAEAIATFAHFGQVDKNGHDYIAHPRAVYYRVYADDEHDYDGQVAAFLHDVLEDTNITAQALLEFFPAYIVDAVIALSFRYYDKNETRDEYYERVKANAIAFRVKLHDIAHNMSPKRLDKLDEATRARLIKKYLHALEVLGR